LHQSLKVLEEQIRAKGSFICYRRGPCAVEQLLDICRETGARAVFFNNVYDPLSLVRDHEVKCRLDAAGVLARSFNAELLYEPWEVVDDTGKPFTTFEAFWRKCVAFFLQEDGMGVCLACFHDNTASLTLIYRCYGLIPARS
jgi:cryptochrome 1